ncbi:geranylgeranyl reductase family protein [[Eubacterium] cellulosolvens]
MDEIYDAVIIGGGIAGSTTGGQIAQNGYKVLIIEEHHEVGKPVQCAGLVTPRIFDLVPENGCILNKVRGAKIYSPHGSELMIDAGKTKAVVIDRVRFDQNCMTMALRAGCELWLGAKAVHAKYSKTGVSVKIMRDGKYSTVNARLLIGADGVQSRVARWFGLKTPKTILSGFGAELSGADVDPRFVELYLGKNVAPNFFSWVIPRSSSPSAATTGRVPVRVGLACTKTKKNAYEYYQQLFTHPILGPKLNAAKPIQYIAGGIPIGLVPKSYTNNVMLVGDAAGQVKPTSGGGVYTSIVCARHCADAAKLAFQSSDYSAKRLKSYQKAWQDELGKELKHGFRLFRVFMHLRDDQLEEGFKLLGKKNILDIISSEGDIDYPSRVTLKLFKRVPQLLKFAKPYLRSFF